VGNGELETGKEEAPLGLVAIEGLGRPQMLHVVVLGGYLNWVLNHLQVGRPSLWGWNDGVD